MDWHNYTDGNQRTVIRVVHHVLPESIATAVALCYYTPEEIGKLGKGRLEAIVRDRYYANGEPETWPERDEGEEFEAAYDAALARVLELWPELTIHKEDA